MKTRKINRELIREWIKQNGKGATTKLAFESGCSPSTIQLMCSEESEVNPTLSTIDGICRVTGYSFDELFPVCETARESA